MGQRMGRGFLAAALGVAALSCQGKGTASGAAGGVRWVQDLPGALAKASVEDKVVMVDFYTDWCHWCRKLDETTFADAAVRRALDGLVAVKLDAERGGREAAVQYRVDAYPTLLFLDAKGSEVGRIPGYLPPQAFLEELKDILGPS